MIGFIKHLKGRNQWREAEREKWEEKRLFTQFELIAEQMDKAHLENVSHSRVTALRVAEKNLVYEIFFKEIDII